MKILHNQKGSTHIVLILGVLVLGIVAFGGWRVWHNHQTKTANTSTTSSHSTATTVPTKIQSKTDVQQASAALSNQATTNLDPSQLDTGLSGLL